MTEAEVKVFGALSTMQVDLQDVGGDLWTVEKELEGADAEIEMVALRGIRERISRLAEKIGQAGSDFMKLCPMGGKKE